MLTPAELRKGAAVVGDVAVRVISPRTLYLMKRDTVRPLDHADAAALLRAFQFEEP